MITLTTYMWSWLYKALFTCTNWSDSYQQPGEVGTAGASFISLLQMAMWWLREVVSLASPTQLITGISNEAVRFPWDFLYEQRVTLMMMLSYGPPRSVKNKGGELLPKCHFCQRSKSASAFAASQRLSADNVAIPGLPSGSLPTSPLHWCLNELHRWSSYFRDLPWLEGSSGKSSPNHECLA